MRGDMGDKESWGLEDCTQDHADGSCAEHLTVESYTVKCDDDIRYCQNAFGCLPVADIVKRRTCKFLQKFDVADNVICQACTRR